MHPNPLEIKPGRIFILRCVRKSEHTIWVGVSEKGTHLKKLIRIFLRPIFDCNAGWRMHACQIASNQIDERGDIYLFGNLTR